MPKKIGRNSSCPCGSGNKYKRCCLLRKNQIIQEKLSKKYVVEKAKVLFDNEKKQVEALKQIGIYSFFPRPLPFNNGYLWSIGKSIYRIEPGHKYTFHEFILGVFLDLLGEDWETLQLNLPENERHFIAQCYLKDSESKKNVPVAGDGSHKRLTVVPTGWGFYILNLAFDVCSLYQTNDLDPDFLRKLKIRDAFQGSRYEIAVASIFARLGCTVEYLDRIAEDKSKKRHDFNIFHKGTNFKVAIEAKSRHRKGVIHMDGQPSESNLFKGDVARLIRKALRQLPEDIPSYVFIDINSPASPDVPIKNKTWTQDVKKIIEKIVKDDGDINSRWHGIFITNFSYHYQKGSQIMPSEYGIFFNPLIYEEIKDGKFLNMLINALDNYGVIPDYDEHGLILGKKKIYERS